MNALTGTSIVVVGSGFGGLSTACYLADTGADVQVLEKNEQLGGRASRLEVAGFTFNMGPSWYLMPDVYERFFGHFGREPDDYYELKQLDPYYRAFYKDDSRIDVVSDREQMVETFESFEAGAGEALQQYLRKSEDHYELTMEEFVYEDRPRLRDWLDLDVLRIVPDLLQTMDDRVGNYFDDSRLQQLILYTSVYLGGSPRNTPALYDMMSHIDFDLGVYYPLAKEQSPEGERSHTVERSGDTVSRFTSGGMAVVVDAFVTLAETLGVTFECNSEVVEIRREQDGFLVATADGADYTPDVVVNDADYAHTEQKLLANGASQYSADYWESRTLAPSAFLLYLGVEGDVDPLAHHTLVLPTDWTPHLEKIYEEPAWPDDPAYYICIPSESDDDMAPAGDSSLFVFVPIAPGLDDTEEIRDEFRDAVLADLAEHTGVDVRDRIAYEDRFCVSEFVDRYNTMQGSAFGLSHTVFQSAMFRPNRRSSAVDDLYFTGSSTTPGIGVPLCVISGEHTANAVIEDQR